MTVTLPANPGRALSSRRSPRAAVGPPRPTNAVAASITRLTVIVAVDVARGSAVSAPRPREDPHVPARRRGLFLTAHRLRARCTTSAHVTVVGPASVGSGVDVRAPRAERDRALSLSSLRVMWWISRERVSNDPYWPCSGY